MNPKIQGFSAFPANFHRQVFTRLRQSISRGESAFLFGPAGSGKSLILQSLPAKKIKGLAIKYYCFNAEVFLEKIPHHEIATFLDSPSKRVVIIVDHLEALNSPDLALHLKSLRELARNQVSLVFAGNNLLDLDRFGSLKHIVLDNIIFVGPLSKADAKIFVSKLEDIYNTKITDQDFQTIFTLSGGVPRLIKRLVKLTIDGVPYKDDPKLAATLQEIKDFFRLHPQYQFSVPLLETNLGSGNLQRVGDKIGNIAFPQKLTKKEYDLACCLLRHKGEIVSRETIIETLWNNQKYDINDHALDQILHRLRTKLAAARPCCLLETFRGRGVRLSVPTS